MYECGDILLYSLSAWRDTSWSTFKKCFDEVHRRYAMTSHRVEQENAVFYRWQTLRLLSSLGHVDVRFEPQGIAVVVAPPALAALPGIGIRRAVLCGSRAPITTGTLRRAATSMGVGVSMQSQTAFSPYAPTRVEVQADSDERIRATAEAIGIPYLIRPPARTIAQVSVSLEAHCRDLSWSVAEDLNWHREDFDVRSLRFQPASEMPPRTRLSRYQDPATTIWRYRLWLDGQFAELDPDWGRYAILSAHSRRILQFDPTKREVIVPLGTPLPVLFARALGLCSGYAPHIFQSSSDGGSGRPVRYQAFRDVPPSIFNMVADKAGQQGPGIGA